MGFWAGVSVFYVIYLCIYIISQNLPHKYFYMTNAAMVVLMAIIGYLTKRGWQGLYPISGDMVGSLTLDAGPENSTKQGLGNSAHPQMMQQLHGHDFSM